MRLRESQAGPGSGSTIVLHDDGGRRGPGVLRWQAFSHWLQWWKRWSAVSPSFVSGPEPPLQSVFCLLGLERDLVDGHSAGLDIPELPNALEAAPAKRVSAVLELLAADSSAARAALTQRAPWTFTIFV